MEETLDAGAAPALDIKLLSADELSLRRRYSCRKFVLCLGGLITSFILLWFGKLNGGEYVTLSIAIYGLFAGANVWEKRA